MNQEQANERLIEAQEAIQRAAEEVANAQDHLRACHRHYYDLIQTVKQDGLNTSMV